MPNETHYIIEQCKRTGIKTLYDITALYEGHIPQDERAFFMGGMPNETHYIIRKAKIDDMNEDFLFDSWERKDQELDLFYNKGQIKEKKVANPVSSLTWLLQNIGLILWPWFVLHNLHNFFTYIYFLAPSFCVMMFLMKTHDGDLAK